MEEENKSSICRVCLNCDLETNGKGLSIFEEQNECVISDKIKALASVDIKEGDGLPDRICAACLLDLKTAYNFKLKCESTNQVLLSSLNTPTKLEDELSMKEEFLSEDDRGLSADDGQNCSDENITQEPLKVLKPSKAIDLKLICDDCGGSFKSKCKLGVHWKRVHMPERLKCHRCCKKFKSYQTYNMHQKKKIKSCVTAGQVRIEGEGKNRTFYCRECDYQSHRIESIKVHLVVHTGERRFTCKICAKMFTQYCGLQSHMESTHPVNNMKCTCSHCGKQFLGRIKMNAHIRIVHKSTSHPCPVCNSILKSKTSLKDHLKRHAGVKAYTCEVCAKTFCTISNLYTHKISKHAKPKQYRCDICQYTARTTYIIKKHKSKHSATNSACIVCGRFLENELQLLLHKKRHTNRNYSCSYCDKTFYSGKNLSAHVRTKHRIVKLPDKITKLNNVK